ncbi:MAG: DUF1844 domain-containing protein [Bryobacteraceae bacterium]|nr:DUF1844 domain-containing protein [Bryobacteraceae bacterium]
MSDQDIPLPPASFEFLVLSFRMQAEMQLGLSPYGNEPAEPNLPFARHSIDMLAMIQEKTRGNLSLEEQRLIENSLTELRFRYMHVFEEQKKKAAEPAPTPTDAPTPADPA